MSFRYHLVAVGSVVVAVIAGLVLGAAAWKGPVSEPVRSDVDATRQPADEQPPAPADRLSVDQRLAEELAPIVLSGRLATRSVVIVATTSAAADVAGVTTMLGMAGASVTGRIELTDRFADPRRGDDLRGLAVASLPPGVRGGLPSTTDGVLATAALFAAVLVRQPTRLPDGDVRGVLTAYISQGYVTEGSSVSGPADAVIVLSGATGEADALTRLVAGLTGSAPVVLAATAADGPVAQLRSGGNRTKVSTVDNLGTPQGKLATAWALADQFAGRVGHYGTGPGATGALPSPPSPSPSASPSPSPSPSPSTETPAAPSATAPA